MLFVVAGRWSVCYSPTQVVSTLVNYRQVQAAYSVSGRLSPSLLRTLHHPVTTTMYAQYKHARLQPAEDVIKSPNDPKDYRVIRLENGLTALLIADKDSQSDNPVSTDQEKDKGDKLAAAALCVGVGSFSDPADLPGLAHFLEHMVFMGSEKYPNENEFDEYVKKHGGMNNAYTECEHTVYYFNIEKGAFQKGLDIFSGFFTKPLMKEGSVDREIKAVDSEFSMSKPRDNPRLEQLYCSMAKSGHPMSKFTWGNLLSLKENPAKQGINLHGRVREFYASAYSAQYMTLVVQAMYPLDTLEEWVTEIFSAVPNIGTPRPTFEGLKEPFDTDRFNKLYKMVPCMNKHRVVITWSLPTLLKHYKSKPLHYLSFLVGHEGKGSIMAYLRRNMLAVTLEGGNSEYGYEHNTTHAVFTVTIQLTETGFDNYEQVVAIVMEYMNMLRREGPKNWIYNEIKTIEDNSFRWIEETDPVENVETIVPNMLKYPVPEFFTGDKLYTEYNPELISECLNKMTPDKANITLLSKKFISENCCTLKEPWYTTPYTFEDIPADLLRKWAATEPRPELHLPEPNAFIATDFSLKEVNDHTEYPIAISESPQSRLWYKQDNKFKVPKGNVSFLLISPAIKASAASLCLMDIMLEILDHQMTETAYAASVASLGYALKRRDHGLSIVMCGFSHKLLKLFKTVVDFIASLTVDEKLLDTMKKQLEKDYYNKSIRPRQLNTDLRLAVLRRNEQTLVDCQQALPSITVAMVSSFVREITSAVYIEGLIQGNITAQEAKEYESYLITTLNCQPITGGTLPQDVILDLPGSELFIRTDNLNNNDENSVITNYYQHGPCDFHKLAINDLLLMRMEEPCFDILRTREQLGYSVGCTSRLTDGIIAFSVSVCSQAHKFDLETLNKKIESFLVEFEALLEKDTEEDFDTVRNSLITLKLCADSNIGEEVERNWNEICDRLYNFDIQHRVVDELRKLTLVELRAWFKSLVASGGVCKKLSIQVEGHKSAAKETQGEEEGGEEDQAEDDEEEGEEGEEDGEEEEEGEAAELEPESYTFQDLVFKPVDGVPATSVITDIVAVQQGCSFYPPSKLT